MNWNARQTIEKTVTSPSEYEEVVEAAETLGFEPVKHELFGYWKAEGEPVYVNKIPGVEKTGRKYFYVRMTLDDYDRDLWRFEPADSDSSNPGEMVVTLAECREDQE